jgi:hypothetical protein
VNTNVTYSCPNGRYFETDASGNKVSVKTSVCNPDTRWDSIYNNLTCQGPDSTNVTCNSSLLPAVDGFSSVPIVKSGPEGKPNYTVKYFQETYTDVFVCSETGVWNRYLEGANGKL